MRVRAYGSAPRVVLLHGGPGAPGEMAEVARELSREFGVLEPFQRRSGREPLTVARHVADLHELLTGRCAGERPALVGHSWGAMLALAYAAAHAGEAACLLLVGCGTFDPVARARLQAIRESRMDGELRARLAKLESQSRDPDERLRAMGELFASLDSYDAADVAPPAPAEPFDARGSEETWQDMLRLQEQGVYPAAFSAIDAPVLMLHGAFDPHPGRLIHASLAPFVRRLEYRELERCGHTPWRERSARDDFFAALRSWLACHLGAPLA